MVMYSLDPSNMVSCLVPYVALLSWTIFCLHRWNGGKTGFDVNIFQMSQMYCRFVIERDFFWFGFSFRPHLPREYDIVGEV